jgi:hypothetical protein
MKIEHTKVKVRDLVNGFVDSQDCGVVGFGGKLNIRPAYQREYVYNDKQRNAVIQTLMKGFPLNTMYWSKNADGTFEVLDGQQRTISICQYFMGKYSVDLKSFHNLPQDRQDDFLDYELSVYVCDGKDSEKLEWFRTINIAGVQLTEQELRNAAFTGTWLVSAKEHFSKPNCVATMYEKYLTGSCIKQEYFETALRWVTNDEKDGIESYMGEHQNDANAGALWSYMQSVFDIARVPKEMKGIDWGLLYNKYNDLKINPIDLKTEIDALMMDDEISKKSGIYEYVLSRNEKFLNLRKFSDSMKRSKYEEQGGICPKCTDHFDISEMDGDHIKPWSEGGKTNMDNLQMLCKACNRSKSNK